MSKAYFSLETGIRAAKSDAKHDFGSAYKPKIVEAELPDTPLSASIKFVADKDYMAYYVYADGEKNPLKLTAGMATRDWVKTMSGDAIASKMKPDISNNYEIFTFRNGKANESEKDEEATKDLGDLRDGERSEIQTKLNEIGVVSDVFIICDVAYSWLKYDLRKASRKKDQIFWWTSVLQTGFDPAGKMAWHTGKPYGFANPKSKFKFCWEPVLDKSVPRKEYLPWPAGETEIGEDKDDAMLCLRKKLLMLTEVDSGLNWNYRDYSSYLMVFDEANKKYIYASKEMAAKKYKMSRGVFASYFAKAKELLKMCVSLLKRSPSVKEVDDYTLQYQMLAKRCGDMPQALACLDKTIKFQTLVDSTTGPSVSNVGLPNDLKEGRLIVRDGEGKGSGTVFQTNGNNMFVSYDQIAVAQALNYRVPIVMYEQQLGMSLFVSKTLRSPLARLNSILVPYDGQDLKLVFTDKEGTEHLFKRNAIVGQGELVSEEMVQNMNDILGALWVAFKGYSQKESEFATKLTVLKVLSDNDLQELLTAYFSELATIRMLISVGTDIRNLTTIIDTANQEFRTITGVQVEIFTTIFNENGEQLGYSFNHLAFRLGISRIFADVTKGQDSLSVDDVQVLVERLSAAKSLHSNILDKIKQLQSQYQDILVQIFLDNVLGVETPRGVVGNIKKINPSSPQVFNVTGRNPETKIFNLAELIFQHEKVMKPIVDCLTIISPESQLYDVVKHFVEQVTNYVNKMVEDENKVLEKYYTYQIVMNKAIERLGILFDSLGLEGQVGGDAGMKRGRNERDDDEEDGLIAIASEQDDKKEQQEMALSAALGLAEKKDEKNMPTSAELERPVKRARTIAAPNIFEKEIVYENVYELLGWAMALPDRFADATDISWETGSNMLNLDDLLKNVFNILTFYFLYNEEHEMPDVLDTLNLRGLYEKIGNLYLKVEEADLSEETSGENDVSQNLYLFNALESQVYDCQTTIYGGEKVATLLYLLLNQVDNKGPFLYPGMQKQLEQMERDLPTLVKQMNELNFSELRRIIGMVFGTKTGREVSQIEFRGDYYDSEGFPLMKVQPTLEQVTVVGGKRRSKVRKTKDKKRAKRMAKRNKKTKRKLKRVVRQTRKNRKNGRKQTRRKVNRRK